VLIRRPSGRNDESPDRVRVRGFQRQWLCRHKPITEVRHNYARRALPRPPLFLVVSASAETLSRIDAVT
jgi:hypothetical protein